MFKFNWTTSQKIQAKKTVSWTLISMTITFFVVFAFTGDWGTALAISPTERIIKVVLYYPHERWWHKRYKIQKKETGNH